MIHEVMILDNSGFDLGLILYGTNLKFAMYGAIIANFFLTPGFEWYYSIPIYSWAFNLSLPLWSGLLNPSQPGSG